MICLSDVWSRLTICTLVRGVCSRGEQTYPYLWLSEIQVVFFDSLRAWSSMTFFCRFRAPNSIHYDKQSIMLWLASHSNPEPFSTWRRGQEARPHFLLACLPQARLCLWECVGTSGTPTHLAAVLRPSRFSPQKGRSLMYWVHSTGKIRPFRGIFCNVHIHLLGGNSKKVVTLTVGGCYELGWSAAVLFPPPGFL